MKMFTRREADAIYRELIISDQQNRGASLAVVPGHLMKNAPSNSTVPPAFASSFQEAHELFGAPKRYSILKVATGPLLLPRSVLVRVERTKAITLEHLIGPGEAGFGSIDIRPDN